MDLRLLSPSAWQRAASHSDQVRCDKEHRFSKGLRCGLGVKAHRPSRLGETSRQGRDIVRHKQFSVK